MGAKIIFVFQTAYTMRFGTKRGVLLCGDADCWMANGPTHTVPIGEAECGASMWKIESYDIRKNNTSYYPILQA